MKLNSNSSLKLVSFFPLVLLLLLSSYFVYTAYTEYQDSVNFKDKLSANKILKNLSVNLAKERDLSVVFYGSKGKIGKNILERQRKMTNVSVKNFVDYYKNKPVESIVKAIYAKLTSLSEVRKKIDNLKIPFNQIFFGYYSKINSLIHKEYGKILNIQITPKILSEVVFEETLLNEMEKTSKERGLVSYVISKGTPFSGENFSLWLRTFSSPDLKNFNIDTSDIGLKNRLYAIFNNINAKKLYKKLVRSKIEIIKGSDIGYYQIDPSTWYRLMTSKISLLDRADSAVSIQAYNDTNDWFQDSVQPKITIGAGILVLSIFLLIVGFFIERYIIRSIKELEKLFGKVGQLADIDEEIDFQTAEGIEKGYRIIEIAIDQIQQDKQIALEASKAKSIFLANMSHEIRTPLNGIIGFTELLKNTNISGEERDFVNIIEKSSENLLEIINNILDLSKIESDKIEIEEIPFSPIEEFENAVEVFAAKAAEKDIRLSFFMDPSLHNELIGDPTRIKEVLINLISNAIKFTPIGGEVDVEIRRIGTFDNFGKTKIQFVVKDTGIGIAEDKIKTIFDAFSQADSTVTRKYGGTGLGLTISAKFISMMGGKLEVDSKVGKGSKFYFTIELGESSSNNVDYKNSFSGFKCALLTSEIDKKNHTQYLYDYLKYFGCDIVFFYGYEEVYGLTTRENINFLVLDVDYLKDNEIEEYKKISIHGTIILKSSQQTISDKYTNEYLKIIYEPVNVTKLVNVLKNSEKFLPKETKVPEKEVLKERKNKEVFDGAPSKEEKTEDKNITKILVAEDNDINRKLIKRTLENYNIQVSLANNGEEALNMVKNEKFDLIFMDIAMPVMDGVESLHRILDYEISVGAKHTPIVALTANALKGDRERFLNEGFDEYVTKPVKTTNIESVLNKFLFQNINLSEINEVEKDLTRVVEPDEIIKETKEAETDYDQTEQVSKSSVEEENQIFGLKSNNEEENLSENDFGDEKESEKPEMEQSEEKEVLTPQYGLKTDEEQQDSVEKGEESTAKESDFNLNQKEEFLTELDGLERSTSFDIFEEKEKDIEKESISDMPSGKKSQNEIEALIAEDNAINQKLIEKTLFDLGLKVDIANNGEEAIEKFKNKKYDIVFMDISMPVMDGIEATHEILAYEKENSLEHTPVVALTANALPGDREAFLQEGLDEYISKPLKKDDILRVLRLFLDYKTDDNTPKSSESQENKEEQEFYYSGEFDHEEDSTINDEQEVEDQGNDNIFAEPEMKQEQESKNLEEKDVLVFKNNKIEAKILENMIKKMGYDSDQVTNYDDFLAHLDKNHYKMVMFDKEIEFVDTGDIIDKIKTLSHEKGGKIFAVEFVSVQDSSKEDDLPFVDEIMDNVINKQGIREILKKYIGSEKDE